MKIIKSILRVSALLCLGIIAMALFFGIENDTKLKGLLIQFCLDKTV